MIPLQEIHMKPIPYAKHSINDKDIEAVVNVLKGEAITRGPKTEELEKALANDCGAEYAVTFNSGTSALTAAFHAMELNANDTVITTPVTFIGTVAGAVLRGAKVVFVDIDPETGNLDLDKLEQVMNKPSTRGREVILPVHLAGIPVDCERIDRSIRLPGSFVIEDAAHALGSMDTVGNKIGSCAFSKMAVFSLHPAKQIACGEGGAVMTNDPDVYNKLVRFRNNGIERDPNRLKQNPGPWYYEVVEATGNYHISEIHSALALSQLSRLDQFAAQRRELVSRYREKLKDHPYLFFSKIPRDDTVSYHLFVVQIDFEKAGVTRSEVMEKLKEKGIGTQVHYIPLYRHPLFKEHGGDISDYFPNTEAYYAKALSLPLHVEMSNDDVDRICDTLLEVIGT